MMELECRHCGFKFRKERIPLRCPYCSKEGRISLPKTAQDLIDETIGESMLVDNGRKRRI
jgi:predicted Zn-ribbon and HTH transcriptional regulator